MGNKSIKQYKSLQRQTLLWFAMWMCGLLLVSAPLFYLVTKHFYAEDMIDIIESVEAGNGIPTLDLEQDILIGMTLQFVLVFGIVGIALIITLKVVTHKLWSPFHKTLEKVRNHDVTQDELPKFENGGLLEFKQLNDALENLMQRDHDAFRVQKEFTENASHELQTPLAITRSRLDILLQEDLSETALSIVSGLYDMNLKMEKLNRELLLLAKIENHQFGNREKIDVDEFLRNLIPNYEALCSSIDLTIVNKLQVQANPLLLESMVNNLVANAIRHLENYSLPVILTLRDKSLEVKNRALTNQPLDSSKIFKRFHTDEATGKGTGLGLAIVKAICDYHDWELNYEFKYRHHCFQIIFN